MPAYFDLEFQYKKSDINSSTVKDFFSSLTGCGLVYKCGYWHSENDSLEEILTWNQAKIQSNFELGYDEHFSNGYKQMLFEFNDFSEVRLFINNESDCDSFSFHLIIPEDDFLDYSADDEVIRLTDRMNIIKDLAVRMWQAGGMSCIQTSWECSVYETL